MSKIDLGKKWGNDIEPIKSVMDKTHYPSLCLDNIDDKRIAEMPDTGTLVIHYKIRDRTHSERKDEEGKGKKRSTSVTLDVTHVDPPAKAPKKKSDPDGGARKAFSEYFKDK
jgi:hypothetical protein